MGLLVWTLGSAAPLGKSGGQPEFTSPPPTNLGPTDSSPPPHYLPPCGTSWAVAFLLGALLSAANTQLPPKPSRSPVVPLSAPLGPFPIYITHDVYHTAGALSFRVHAQWKVLCTGILGLPPSSQTMTDGSTILSPSASSVKWMRQCTLPAGCPQDRRGRVCDL